MYQETLSPNGGRLRDTLSVFALLIAVIVIEVLGGRFSRDIMWLQAAVHLVAFLGLVIFCWCFYRFRLTGFRYTLFTDEADTENEDEDYYKGPETTLPPCGTFAAERMMGDVGACIETVAPEEILTLVPYVGAHTAAIKRYERATRLSKKTASVLIYVRNGVQCGLIIHPSKELTDRISAVIEKNRKAQG